jgi:hypothetical protein
MKKTLTVIILTLTLLWILAPLCFAEEAAATGGKSSNFFKKTVNFLLQNFISCDKVILVSGAWIVSPGKNPLDLPS